MPSSGYCNVPICKVWIRESYSGDCFKLRSSLASSYFFEEQLPQGDNRWIMNPFFDYNYGTSYTQINKALEDSAVYVRGGTHTLRKTAAEIAHQRGVPDSEIKAAGRWGTEKEQARYTGRSSCPRSSDSIPEVS